MSLKNSPVENGSPELKAVTGSQVNIFGRPHPLKDKVVQAQAPEGTLKEILGDVNPHAIIQLNGEIIDHENLDQVSADAGDTINISMNVQGGDDGNKVLRTVLQVAIVAAAIYTGGLAASAMGLTTATGALTLGGKVVSGIVSSAVMIGGNIAVNALVPPPSMNLKSGDGEEFKRLGALTGTRNNFSPYAPVPKVYGKRKVFPLMSAKPFTEVQSNVQYLHLLFCVGHGPVRLSNPKIGDTAIGTFDSNNQFTSNDNFESVKIDVAEKPRYYTNDVDQNDVGVAMNDLNVATRTTAQETDEAGIDFIFPRGLFAVNSDGDIIQESVGFKIEYRETGSGDPWTNPFEETVTYVEINRFGREDRTTRTYPYVVFEGDEKETLRDGVTIEFPTTSQYDIRVERVSSQVDPQDGQAFSDCTWTSLKSVTYEDPVDMPGVVQIGMRIKATDQLNGVLDNFSVEVESRLATYDSGTGSWDVPTFDPSNGTGTGGALTGNPAWVYADVLAGNANPDPVPRADLDGDELENWAGFCISEGFEFNSPGDSKTTVFEMLKNVASVGRASWGLKDGKFTVVQDRPTSTPVQVFTPRNSWDFAGNMIFPDIPHGLKVRYVNPNKGWTEDERIVYDDGYTSANATDFQVLNLPGVTSADHAWKMGRYFLATMRLRPETYTLNADVEHIVCQRGDLVRVNHDVPQWGLAYGRIKDLTTDVNGDVDTVTVDQPVDMEAGTDFVIGIRTDQDRNVVEDVVTNAGTQTTLTLGSPIPAAKNVSKGDLFFFGKLGSEAVDLRVKEIRPRENLNAEIHLVNDSPAIYQAGILPVDFAASDVDATNNLINASGHGLYDGDQVQLSTTGTLPSPLASGTDYWIVERTADTFKLASSEGGPPIDITGQGSGTHTATRQIPNYDPQISEPIQLEEAQPPAPTIEGVRSDETTLSKDADGSMTVKMVISFDLDKGLPAALVEARMRKQGVPSGWTGYKTAEASNGVISLPGVNPGDTYVAQIRTINTQNGNTSDWIEAPAHTVDGKVGPPSNVDSLTAELDQVLIRLSWPGVLNSDLQEYEIRKGSDWASGTVMKNVDATETTLKVTTTGQQTYWIKAIDTSGNYSNSATSATVNVPTDWLDDVARVGGSQTFQDLTLNSGTPFIDFIESDLADKNWRQVPISGDLVIQERNDAGTVVATPMTIEAGAPTDSLHVYSSGKLGLGAQATAASHAVRADRSLTVQGTSGETTVTGGSQDLTGDRTWTVGIADALAVPTSLAVGGALGSGMVASIHGNVELLGDVDIGGTVNYLNETNLQVEDKTITVNKNGTDGSAEGAGLIVERPSGNRSMLWDSTNGFLFNDSISIPNNGLNVGGTSTFDGQVFMNNSLLTFNTTPTSDIENVYPTGAETFTIKDSRGNDHSFRTYLVEHPDNPTDEVLTVLRSHRGTGQGPGRVGIVFDPLADEIKIHNGGLIGSYGDFSGNFDVGGLFTVGGDIYPAQNYTSNIGAVNKKFLSLHAAELRVSTLVAAEERTTTGGRFLVGQATELTSAIGTGDTTIEVKHNNLGSGDIVQMEGGGQLEFMSVDSAASGTGPYTYTVTRNLDGSGANAWDAGDAVFNTGQAGEGFLDLYAINSITQNTATSGPTIAHMVRTGPTYNSIEARAVSGNLKGHFGIGSDLFGFAAGKESEEHIIIDPVDGISMFSGSNLTLQANGGILKVGASGTFKYTASNDTLVTGGWTVNSNHIKSPQGRIRMGRMEADTTVDEIRISRDQTGGGTVNYIRMYQSGLGTYGIEGVHDSSRLFHLGQNSEVIDAEIAGWNFDSGKLYAGNIEINSSGMIWHTGTRWLLDSDGSGYVGNGNINWDSTGYTRIESDVDIFGNLSVQSLPKTADEKLLTLWRFDERTVGIVVDSKGNYDGEVRGNPNYTEGVSGTALSFDGSGDYIWFGDIQSPAATSQVTVSAWVKWNTISGHQAIFTDGGSVNGIEFGIYNGELHLGVENFDSHRSLGYSTSNLSTGVWYHVAATADGVNGAMYIYVNGELVASDESMASYVGFNGSNGTTVGSVYTQSPSANTNYENPAAFHNGLIDEVRIYNELIGQQEIKALYLYPGGTPGGIISANTIRTGRIESDNLDRGSGTFTNTGTLFDLDNGNIISEDFSIIGGTGTFGGNLNAPSGDIGGWEIFNGRIEANGLNQAFIHMISGDKPEFHFRAENGEDLHIGGQYSFDNEEDITVTQTDFIPDLVDQSFQASNGTSAGSSDTHSYDFSNPSSLEGRNLRFTSTQNISATVINLGGTSQSASASCTLTFRLVDSTGATISGYEWTDTDSVSTSDGAVIGRASLTVNVEIPSGVDFAGIEVYWSLSCSTTGSNSTSDASMDVDEPPASIIGTAEFISPLGLQFTNEESTQTFKPRVKLERNTGQGLVHELIVEGPNGRQAKLVMNGSNLELQDVHGSTVRDSWSMTAP